MCSRETQNIFFYFKKSPYSHKRDWKKVWFLITHFNKITYEDTFYPFVCKIKGHKPYQPDAGNEPNDWACKRCHNYIKWNPRKEKLKRLNKI